MSEPATAVKRWVWVRSYPRFAHPKPYLPADEASALAIALADLREMRARVEAAGATVAKRSPAYSLDGGRMRVAIVYDHHEEVA